MANRKKSSNGRKKTKRHNNSRKNKTKKGAIISLVSITEKSVKLRKSAKVMGAKYLKLINNNKLESSIITVAVVTVLLGACFVNSINNYDEIETQSVIEPQFISVSEVENEEVAIEADIFETVEINGTESIDTVETYESENIENSEIDSNQISSELSNSLINVATVNGYQIKVNENPIAFFESKEDAEEVLESLKSKYLEEGSEIIEVKFTELVEIEEAEVVVTDFDGYDDFESALNYIEKGTDKEKTYALQSGDNLWYLAQLFEISVDDLQKANPDVDPGTLQIGQEISLIVPQPLIGVTTIEEITYSTDIDYGIQYEDSSNLFKGETQTKVSGIYGEKEIVSEVIKQDGKRVAEVVLTETILSEPSDRIVYQGTKDPPPSMGNGTYIYPAASRGVVTSEFGLRWGRRHTGIDIGMPTGTGVKATDGGVVIAAGWSDSYGYYVKIDHGANIVTLYAHNSQLLVSTGEQIFQGQQIALSGNTGNSTGPHLHFEVQVNGVSVDPRGYVSLY